MSRKIKRVVSCAMAIVVIGVGSLNCSSISAKASDTDVAVSASYDDQNQEVNIPDENLRLALLSALKITDTSHKLTIDELNKVKRVYASNVDNLEGLRYCTRLKTIRISDSTFTDLNEIKDLKYIENLEFVNCELNDISAIENMDNVINLYLHSTKVSDISVIPSMDSLKILDIGESNITDLEPLRGNNKLVMLCVDGINCHNNNNKDVLSTLSGLMELVASNCNMKNEDLNILDNMPNVYILGLNNNKLTNIDVLNKYNQLQYVEICYNKIKDFSPLDNTTVFNSLVVTLDIDKQKFDVDDRDLPAFTQKTIDNPYVNKDGTPMIPISNDSYSYDAATNKITFLKGSGEYSIEYPFTIDYSTGNQDNLTSLWQFNVELGDTPIESPDTPTETEVPTESPDAPTETEVPTESPDAPTETEVPTESPDAPTETEVPTESPDAPTETEVPTESPNAAAETEGPKETLDIFDAEVKETGNKQFSSLELFDAAVLDKDAKSKASVKTGDKDNALVVGGILVSVAAMTLTASVATRKKKSK